MTIRFLCEYGPYKVNNTVALSAAEETSLVGQKLASTDLTGGTPYVAPAAKGSGRTDMNAAEFAAFQGLVSGAGINTLILFGTSIEANNNVNNGLTPPSFTISQSVLADTGHFTWANILMGSPFQVLRNAGIPGDTTAGMLARLQTDVLAYGARWVVVGGPINDITTGVPAATIIANLRSIYTQIAAAGSKLVALTLLPNNSINSGGSAAQKEAFAYVNAWIRAYGTTTGAIVIDTFSSIYDPTTSCGAAAGMLSDSTHPGTLGAWTIGTAIKAVLSPLVRAQPVVTNPLDVVSATYPYGNILIGMSGVAGSDGSTSLHSGSTVYTGAAPVGWWLQGISDSANCAATLTLPARTDKPGKRWWQTVVTYTSAQAAVATWQFKLLAAAALPSAVPIGATLDAEIELNFTSLTNVGALEVRVEARDSGNATLAEASFVYNQSVTTPEPAFSGVVAVRGLVVPANTTNVMVRIIPRNLAATNGGFTLQIGDVVLRQRGLA